jgi:CheY-like chemotaxis protein
MSRAVSYALTSNRDLNVVNPTQSFYQARNPTHMLTILLVDDNVHLQIAFKKVLTSSGYRVELAGDGEEGLRLARSIRPDVILLDMLLPKLGGVEVLRALKADRATATIPVIALSGLPMSNETRLRRDGAISYLQKSNLEDLDFAASHRLRPSFAP